MKTTILQRLPESARLGLVLFLAARLVTVVIAWLVMATRPDQGITEILTNWDGNWNEIVATDLYRAFENVESSVLRYQTMAFFPLLPLAARGLHDLTGIGIHVVGPLVSMFFGALGFALLGRYLADKVGRPLATATMVFMLFSPNGFVLSMFYTEGLMILFTVLTMRDLDEEKWTRAGLWALLGGLTRPTGFVLFVPCLVAAVVHLRSPDRTNGARAVLAPVLAPIGFLAWVAIVAVRTGSPTGYFAIQSEAWGARLDFGRSFLDGLIGTFVEFDRDLDVRISVMYVAIFGFGGLYLAWKQKMSATWLALAAALVVLTAFNARQASGARFLLPAFPLFVAWARSIRIQWHGVVVAGSAAVMGALFFTSVANLNYTP